MKFILVQLLFFVGLTQVWANGEAEKLREATQKLIGQGLILDQPNKVPLDMMSILSIRTSDNQSSREELAGFVFDASYLSRENVFVIIPRLVGASGKGEKKAEVDVSSDLFQKSSSAYLTSEQKRKMKEFENTFFQSFMEEREKYLGDTKKDLAQRTLLQVFSHLKHQRPVKIILTVTESHGLGDLIFVQKSVELLKRRFGNPKISVITDLPDSLNRYKQLSDKDTDILVLDEANSQLIQKLYRESDIQIAGPTDLFYLNPDARAKMRLMGIDPNQKNMIIHEYDLYSNHSSQNLEYQAGLGPHSLGVFVDSEILSFSKNVPNEDQKLAKLAEVGHKDFLRILQGDLGNDYFKRNRLFFAHFTNPGSISHFVNAVAGIENQTDPQNVDIVSTVDLFLLERLLDPVPLVEGGFSEVIFVRPGMPPKKLEIPELSRNSSRGKVLRVIHSRFTHSDIRKIIMLSQPVVGCTGDQSLSEVISKIDSVPVYEIYPHKRNFVSRMKNLIPNGYLLSPLFFDEGREVNSRDLVENLKTPYVRQAAKQLQDTILRDWQIDDNYIGAMNFEILQRLDPGLAKIAAEFKKRPDPSGLKILLEHIYKKYSVEL